MALFSIWEGEGISLIRGPGPPRFGDGTPMDPTDVKVKEFQADSWNEACQVYNDHCGWGKYKTPEEDGLEGWEKFDPDEE